MVLYTNLWISFVRGVFRKYKDIARCIGDISLRCVFCQSWEYRLAISCSRYPVYLRYHFFADTVLSFPDTMSCICCSFCPRNRFLYSPPCFSKTRNPSVPLCPSKTPFPAIAAFPLQDIFSWPKPWELENFGGEKAKEYLLHSCWHRSYRAQN